MQTSKNFTEPKKKSIHFNNVTKVRILQRSTTNIDIGNKIVYQSLLDLLSKKIGDIFTDSFSANDYAKNTLTNSKNAHVISYDRIVHALKKLGYKSYKDMSVIFMMIEKSKDDTISDIIKRYNSIKSATIMQLLVISTYYAMLSYTFTCRLSSGAFETNAYNVFYRKMKQMLETVENIQIFNRVIISTFNSSCAFLPPTNMVQLNTKQMAKQNSN